MAAKGKAEAIREALLACDNPATAEAVTVAREAKKLTGGTVDVYPSDVKYTRSQAMKACGYRLTQDSLRKYHLSLGGTNGHAGNGHTTNGSQPVTAPPAAPKRVGNFFSLEELREAKQFVNACGGLDMARERLAVLEAIMA